MEAKVHISLREGVLQIEGSEAFVSAQLAKLEPHVIRVFDAAKAGTQETERKGSDGIERKHDAHSSTFENLFAQNGEVIQILKGLPGGNNTEKTVNGGLLLALAREHFKKEPANTDHLRELCKSHACLDPSNFARMLKEAKEHFLLEGTGRLKTIRLTVPGRKKAMQLATQLNGA